MHHSDSGILGIITHSDDKRIQFSIDRYVNALGFHCQHKTFHSHPETNARYIRAAEFLCQMVISSSTKQSCDGTKSVRLTHNFKRSEEHTSELQSRFDIVCRLLL